ncbi:hypothetical protein [Rhizobium sp. RU36D]|uniref:hypothetical protein n=1 Tax=Rhizobium sp. RU36D TaxID=1907415 RepID=UPI0009D7A7F8|nr:hypothetical protein [Rhizobium sp. RU36D]SMD19493.1 hypothetical protein SAMN05880593_14121 [Rhizobium sp. RU36D]
MIKGEQCTAEKKTAWEAKIRKSYGNRTAKMRQELDAIPAESEGAALTRGLIERCMSPDLPGVVRWDRDDHARAEQAEEFCEGRLSPLLRPLNVGVSAC